MTPENLFQLNQKLDISVTLVEAIKAFPIELIARHCETNIVVSPFEIDATCPVCGGQSKVRSFAAAAEVQDVFDAVFEWLLQPGTQSIFQRRQQQISDDP